MNSLFRKFWKLSPQKFVHEFAPKLALKIDSMCYFQQRASLGGIIDSSEQSRLEKLPRRTPDSTKLFGRTISIVDADSYLDMLQEIFIRKNYLFKSETDTPFILDCGANIGLSVIFFKLLYPDARIIAFEPDPTVFKALKENVTSFEFKNVELHNKAVWSEETELEFHAEGSWGGSVFAQGAEGHVLKVKSARLKDYLSHGVDFLKIDIEGAESDVLKDCAECLGKVNNLFFEYHSFVTQRQALHELLAILQEAGFRYHIKEASARDTPFIERRTEGMDLQLDIFAFRL